MALRPTIANNTIVSNISGQTAAPAANALTQLLDAMLGAQPGAIIMRHGASWQALAPGAPGQVLQVQTYMANWGPLSPMFDFVGAAGYVHGSIMVRGSTSWTTLPPGAAGSVLQTQGAHADPQWAQPASVPTGVVNPFIGDDRGVPPGWVLASGGTIGGCIVRRHGPHPRRYVFPLAAALYLLARCTGAGLGWSRNRSRGRFQRPKTSRLPDLRGRVAAGKDDMGGTAAGRLTAAGSGVAGTTLGAAGGAETHRLTGGQMPRHSHHITDAGHVHEVSTRADLVNTGRASAHAAGTGALGTTQSATTGITIDNSGGSEAHNNTPPTIVLNYIIKL